MKYFSKILSLALVVALSFTACSKIDNLHKSAALPVYLPGVSPVLSSSATVIAPPLTDSNNTVVTFSWTNPTYSAKSTKYILEIDSAGRGFSNAQKRTLLDTLNSAYLGKELNVALLNLGFSIGVSYDIDVRVISSYANNNEQYVSNTLKLKAKPYQVPPKVVPPASGELVLIGSATAGGWDNPVPLPAQRFKKIDSVTYEGTFYINGGGQYLFLPLNGDWTHKYNVADAAAPGLRNGGDFGLDLGSANIPAPDLTGMYTIRVNFQAGKFTVTSAGLFGLLYAPGDYQTPLPNWTPATAPAIGSPANDENFDGYLNVPSGGSYEFKFTIAPDWNNALGDGGSGTLVPGGGGNLSFGGAGYFHVVASTSANTWAVTPTSWGLVGSFAASNWGNAGPDIPMTYSVNDKKWTGTITTAPGDVFKFRANNDWGINYGDPGTGALKAGGDNIGDVTHTEAIPAGTHTITLYLNNAGYYTYRIQ